MLSPDPEVSVLEAHEKLMSRRVSSNFQHTQSEAISEAGQRASGSNTAVVVLAQESSTGQLRASSRALMEAEDSPQMVAKINVISSPKATDKN